jgi:hypothetical protein
MMDQNNELLRQILETLQDCKKILVDFDSAYLEEVDEEEEDEDAVCEYCGFEECENEEDEDDSEDEECETVYTLENEDVKIDIIVKS